MDNIDHPALIEECKQIFDAENQYVKIPPIKKKMIVMIKLKTGQQA